MIYVDDLRVHDGGRMSGQMYCHLWSDPDPLEVGKMIEKIWHLGARGHRWGKRLYWEITPRAREEAVQLGAQPTTDRAFIKRGKRNARK